MERDAAQGYSATLADAIALSQSLLSGDIAEARFRARLVAGARTPDLGKVAIAAALVVHLLGTASMTALEGFPLAMLALADALHEAAADWT
jgi:hypothetical protein